MRTHLLEGRVRHRRVRPFDYSLDHAVWYLALDLAEVDDLPLGFGLLGRNRPGLVTFRDGDHLDPPAVDLGVAVDDLLRARGIDPAGWQVTLVAYPRVLGHVFNPASFYLCRDPAGELALVIVEVHNTHLERHLYVLEPEDAGGGSGFVASMAKDFYVSPFIDLAGRYAVRVRDEPGRLRISIDLEQDGERVIHTSLDLVRRRLTARNLIGLLVRIPLVTHKTVGLIHWHALRLWRRGAAFHRHGEAVR